jgi:aerobic-type carbon monoxide dehydrogenase small subunit (CoxS/CutS family)
MGISRRRFVEGAGFAAAALPVVEGAPPDSSAGPGSAPANIVADPSVPHTKIKFTLNGKKHNVDAEDRWTLAEMLRDHLGLTGTKIGCDRGECGACTVLIDGKSMYACSQLAVWLDGKSVTTIEGLAQGAKLDPLQEAFIKHDGPQCGFCTSGQLMSAKALLLKNPKPTEDDVRHGMAGNLCRCSNYNHYVEAVLAASHGEPAAKGGRA